MTKIKYLLIVSILIFFIQSCIQGGEDPDFLEFYWDQTGCADPWQTAAINSDEELKVAIVNYLKSQGVSEARISDIKSDPPQQVCLACFCTTGTRIYVEVPKKNKNTMIALGFKEFI